MRHVSPHGTRGTKARPPRPASPAASISPSRRPLFAHANGNRSVLDDAAKQALLWWRDVLRDGTVEERKWLPDQRPPAIVLVDARGRPARLAAVLICDGNIEWSEMEPSEGLRRHAALVSQLARAAIGIHQAAVVQRRRPNCSLRDGSATFGPRYLGSEAAKEARPRFLGQHSGRVRLPKWRRQGTASCTRVACVSCRPDAPHWIGGRPQPAGACLLAGSVAASVAHLDRARRLQAKPFRPPEPGRARPLKKARSEASASRHAGFLAVARLNPRGFQLVP